VAFGRDDDPISTCGSGSDSDPPFSKIRCPALDLDVEALCLRFRCICEFSVSAARRDQLLPSEGGRDLVRLLAWRKRRFSWPDRLPVYHDIIRCPDLDLAERLGILRIVAAVDGSRAHCASRIDERRMRKPITMVVAVARGAMSMNTTVQVRRRTEPNQRAEPTRGTPTENRESRSQYWARRRVAHA
jgi:hypothetical protein